MGFKADAVQFARDSAARLVDEMVPNLCTLHRISDTFDYDDGMLPHWPLAQCRKLVRELHQWYSEPESEPVQERDEFGEPLVDMFGDPIYVDGYGEPGYEDIDETAKRTFLSCAADCYSQIVEDINSDGILKDAISEDADREVLVQIVLEIIENSDVYVG